MEQEFIFKITVVSPLSQLEKGLDIIMEKYNNPQGHSFIFLSADQFGLNTENIFDLNQYSSLILTSQNAIQHFALIFNTAGITVEYINFEDTFYRDFDLNTIAPNELKERLIKHMTTKFNCNHTLGKIISGNKLNEIDFLLITKKLIS